MKKNQACFFAWIVHVPSVEIQLKWTKRVVRKLFWEQTKDSIMGHTHEIKI